MSEIEEVFDHAPFSAVVWDAIRKIGHESGHDDDQFCLEFLQLFVETQPSVTAQTISLNFLHVLGRGRTLASCTGIIVEMWKTNTGHTVPGEGKDTAGNDRPDIDIEGLDLVKFRRVVTERREANVLSWFLFSLFDAADAAVAPPDTLDEDRMTRLLQTLRSYNTATHPGPSLGMSSSELSQSLVEAQKSAATSEDQTVVRRAPDLSTIRIKEYIDNLYDHTRAGSLPRPASKNLEPVPRMISVIADQVGSEPGIEPSGFLKYDQAAFHSYKPIRGGSLVPGAAESSPVAAVYASFGAYLSGVEACAMMAPPPGAAPGTADRLSQGRGFPILFARLAQIMTEDAHLAQITVALGLFKALQNKIATLWQSSPAKAADGFDTYVWPKVLDALESYITAREMCQIFPSGAAPAASAGRAAPLKQPAGVAPAAASSLLPQVPQPQAPPAAAGASGVPPIPTLFQGYVYPTKSAAIQAARAQGIAPAVAKQQMSPAGGTPPRTGPPAAKKQKLKHSQLNPAAQQQHYSPYPQPPPQYYAPPPQYLPPPPHSPYPQYPPAPQYAPAPPPAPTYSSPAPQQPVYASQPQPGPPGGQPPPGAPPQASQVDPYGRPKCFDYLKGNCRFGATCKFSHL